MYWRPIRLSTPASSFRVPLLIIGLVSLFTASSFGAALASTTYDGNWSGTTSQKLAFSFTVANDAVTRIETQFVVPGCTIRQTITGNLPIVGNTFSLSISGTSIQGTFASLSSASGTVQFTSSNPACSGTVNATWNATRTTNIPPNTPTFTATATATATQTATATATKTATATATQTATATATQVATPPAPLIANVAYVPSVLKQDPATAIPTTTPTSAPTLTPTAPPAGQRPHVSITGAREETELRCSIGTNSYIQTPQAGFTFVVVNFKATNPLPGQTLTFSRADVKIVAGDGGVSAAEGDNFVRSDSYCLGGTATFFIPGAEMSYSFVFVPHKNTVTQDYKLRFPNADEVTFKATPK